MFKIIFYLLAFNLHVNAMDLHIGERLKRSTENNKDPTSTEEIKGIEVKDVENTFYVYNTEKEHIKEFTIPDDYPIDCHEHFLPIYVKIKGVKSIEQVHAYLGHSNLKGNYILTNISSQTRHKVCKVIRSLVL